MYKKADLLYFLCVFFCFGLTLGCYRQTEHVIPGHILKMDNVMHISEPAVTIDAGRFLKKEMVFGNSDKALVGTVGSIEIDKKGHVYIADNRQKVLHRFKPDGSFDRIFGREGAGPGEFGFVGKMKAAGDYISVFDPSLFRVTTIATDSLKIHSSFKVQALNSRNFEDLKGLNIGGVIPVDSARMIINFTSMLFPDPKHPQYNLNQKYNLYFLMDRNGHIISEMLFKLPSRKALSATVEGQFRFTMFDFLGSSLIAVQGKEIYMARSGEFLIHKYNLNGERLQSYFYPFKKRPFTRAEAIRQRKREYEEGVTEWQVSVIKNAPEEQIPGFWPALNDLLVDDEGRLWVSTITNEEDYYEWWVISADGRAEAAFLWLAEKPIEAIRNGKLYTRETDPATGLQQVVRYGFELVAR